MVGMRGVSRQRECNAFFVPFCLKVYAGTRGEDQVSHWLETHTAPLQRVSTGASLACGRVMKFYLLTGLLEVVSDLVEQAVSARLSFGLEARHVDQVGYLRIWTILLGFLDLALHEELVAEVVVNVAAGLPADSFNTDRLLNGLKHDAAVTVGAAPASGVRCFPVGTERDLVPHARHCVRFTFPALFFELPLDSCVSLYFRSRVVALKAETVLVLNLTGDSILPNLFIVQN